MDTKALKALVKLMRAQGILVLKTSEVELTLNPEAPMKRTRKKKGTWQDEPLLKEKGFKGYSEEELLMWSSAPVGGSDDEQQV